jgi:branched-chain amino acid aminotransferase
VPPACLDGVLMDASEARVPATDEGLLRGDGVFEVVRVYRGRPFALADHLARMGRSATGLRLDVDLDAMHADVDAVATAAGEGFDGAIRLVATRGGSRVVLAEALKPLPVPAALASVTFAPSRILDGIKSLSYGANMLASRLARERGAHEALLVTPHGRVLEAPTRSFFYVLDGELRTPPLSDHVLDSITRRRLLGLVDVAERPVTLEELAGAEEAFVGGTTQEVVAVSRIDDVELPAAPGPRTAEAAAAFRAHVEAELGVAIA